MSRTYGLSTQDIFPQPGFTATQSDKGGWIGQHTFAIRREAWDNIQIRQLFKNGTPITAIDQSLSSFFSFMTVAVVQVTGEEGDFIIVSVQISGGQSGQFGSGEDGGLSETSLPRYKLTCGLQESSLSLHPKWEDLEDDSKDALGALLNGDINFSPKNGKYGTYDENGNFWSDDYAGKSFPDPSGDELEFAKIIARGQTTYFHPAITWTESTQGNSNLTQAQLNKIGKISDPRGNPPEPSGTRDWMLTSAFQEQTGDLITTELEWTLSERGGFNSFLYA